MWFFFSAMYYDGLTRGIVVPGLVGSSAAKSTIENIIINNGTIIITAKGWNGSGVLDYDQYDNSSQTKKFVISDRDKGELREIK